MDLFNAASDVHGVEDAADRHQQGCTCIDSTFVLVGLLESGCHRHLPQFGAACPWENRLDKDPKLTFCLFRAFEILDEQVEDDASPRAGHNPYAYPMLFKYNQRERVMRPLVQLQDTIACAVP